MDILAADIGNTCVAAARWAGGQFGQVWRVPTGQALPRAAFSGAQVMALASVVPQAEAAFLRDCARWAPEARVALASAQTVPVNGPAGAGADRLVNALAAARGPWPLPAVVVDVGTATTVDLVDAAGRFRGGAILPGPAAGLAGLRQAVAAGLPQVPLARPDSAVGPDTAGALTAGAYWGHIGAIQGVIAAMAAEIGAQPYSIATGGLAPALAPDLAPDALVPDLTLRGLVAMARLGAAGP
ncbi:MAG TPA: pantothenate kinase [Rhodospirillaceae bacterium]|jgi:type III pantothenate kinase|nr:type III pantothenate kinase [Alphaproteobacteria bacterium]HBH26102.1 pantothenate kinase [Rhodospirillaceae bacterium]